MCAYVHAVTIIELRLVDGLFVYRKKQHTVLLHDVIKYYDKIQSMVTFPTAFSCVVSIMQHRLIWLVHCSIINLAQVI